MLLCLGKMNQQNVFEHAPKNEPQKKSLKLNPKIAQFANFTICLILMVPEKGNAYSFSNGIIHWFPSYTNLGKYFYTYVITPRVKGSYILLCC